MHGVLLFSNRNSRRNNRNSRQGPDVNKGATLYIELALRRAQRRVVNEDVVVGVDSVGHDSYDQ